MAGALVVTVLTRMALEVSCKLGVLYTHVSFMAKLMKNAFKGLGLQS